MTQQRLGLISQYHQDYIEQWKPIVIFYGIAGCLKTTLATLLGNELDIAILSPARFGIAHKATGEPIPMARLRRYARVYRQLDAQLVDKKALILDGCFDLPSVKNRLCKLVARNPERHWVAVRCLTNDRNLTLRRLRFRQHCPPAYDALANNEYSLHVTELGLTAAILSAIMTSPGATHFTFDSSRYSLSCDVARKDSAIIGDILDGCIRHAILTDPLKEPNCV